MVFSTLSWLLPVSSAISRDDIVCRDTFCDAPKSVVTWWVLPGAALMFIMAPQVLLLLKGPPCQAGFLCQRFRRPSAIRAGCAALRLLPEWLSRPELFRAG